MSNINWFPGHMAKSIRIINDMIKVIDVIIEVIDARIPFSSSNPVINELCKNRKKIILLNKIDIADDNVTKKWKNHLSKNNDKVILINAKKDNIKKIIIENVRYTLKEKIKKYQKKGLVNYQIKMMILGIPNVGKSTIINRLANAKKAIVGNKPGVTRGKQWIQITDDIQILDTPGILWPKFENEIISNNLAISGCIKPEILDKESLVNYSIKYLIKNYFNLFTKKYFKENQEIENNKESYEYIDILAKKYNMNNYKIIEKLFHDCINNKLGKISWENPDVKNIYS